MSESSSESNNVDERATSVEVSESTTAPLPAVIESVVFASGKPIALKRLASLVSASQKEVEEILDALQNEYASMQRGIRLVRSETTVQMVSAPENAAVVSVLYGKETQGALSDAASETLAIIAYRAPISRPEIEAIRGVNCVYILRNLQLRGLIQKASKQEGRLAAYEPTLELLKHLGISSVKELSTYEQLSQGLASVERGVQEQQSISE
ncbi:MAG: SMC-Scp complex subunit ScpB [Candidatus Doudnabacteria bacterium]|nr:SMC-Scp complex subunit ScpB [Candidatus Doudnabacteria bacterium]MCA9387848.1 SMC-Scp complex subunit ScpB [Candidatus Andersenbacteria bacterium]